MSRAVITAKTERRPAFEPLYEIDPDTGASIEVLHADSALAKSFGCGPGWFWWTCQPGCLPDGLPTGPFNTSYGAFRDALTRGGKAIQVGRRIATCSTKP